MEGGVYPEEVSTIIGPSSEKNPWGSTADFSYSPPVYPEHDQVVQGRMFPHRAVGQVLFSQGLPKSCEGHGRRRDHKAGSHLVRLDF